MTALLDCDIIPAAARCHRETLHAAIRALIERIDTCECADDRVVFGERITQRAVPKLLRVRSWNGAARDMQLYQHHPTRRCFPAKRCVGVETGRRRILEAILSRTRAGAASRQKLSTASGVAPATRTNRRGNDRLSGCRSCLRLIIPANP